MTLPQNSTTKWGQLTIDTNNWPITFEPIIMLRHAKVFPFTCSLFTKIVATRRWFIQTDQSRVFEDHCVRADGNMTQGAKQSDSVYTKIWTLLQALVSTHKLSLLSGIHFLEYYLGEFYRTSRQLSFLWWSDPLFSQAARLTALVFILY